MKTQATSSGEKSASSIIQVLGGYLHGFELNPPQSGQATLKIYDSNEASTTNKLLLTTVTCTAGLNSVYVEFPTPRAVNVGIYAVLTGNTTYTVAYSLG